MTKERLYQYRHLIKELKRLEERIERLEARCEGGAIIITDMPRGGVPPDDLVNLVDARMSMERLRGNVLCELVAIQEFISEIPESRVRLIFSYRYVDGMSWGRIETIMPYSERQIRRIHNKYLKKSL